MNDKLWGILLKVRTLYQKTQKIRIRYSGSGDSGDVENVFLVMERESGEPNVYLNYPDPLYTDLANCGYEISQEAHPGWENNEGATGSVYIELDTGKIRVQHSYYETMAVLCPEVVIQ